MNAPSIIDPFFKLLNGQLTEKIAQRMTSLASGSAVRTENDQVTTAEKYAAQTSYIQALNDVLDLCHEIEVDKYGRKPGEPGDDTSGYSR